MHVQADAGGWIILMCIFTAGMAFGSFLQERLGHKSAKK